MLILFQCSCGDESDGRIAISGKDCGMRLKSNHVQLGGEVGLDFQLKNTDKTVASTTYYVNDMAVEGQKINTKGLPLGKHKVSGKHVYSDSTDCTSFAYVHVTSDIKPGRMKSVRIADFEHDRASFTQGLEWYNGRLYEGTGHYGESLIRHYDPKKLDYKQEVSLIPSYFGEGITIMGDKLYQLTYKEQTGFEYNVNTMEKLREFKYEGEGWGLTNDGTNLIMTDGSNKLTFISPETLEKVKEVFIYNDEQEFVQVNELEYVSGSIYGNVYGSMLIVRIDPKTGKVLDYIDCTGLVKQNEITQDMDVMNGIAFRESSGTFFLTGKNWPKMYEVRFVPK